MIGKVFWLLLGCCYSVLGGYYGVCYGVDMFTTHFVVHVKKKMIHDWKRSTTLLEPSLISIAQKLCAEDSDQATQGLGNFSHFMCSLLF